MNLSGTDSLLIALLESIGRWFFVIWIVPAALCSWILAHLTASLAKRAGALDQPTGGRKIHAHATPLWGGLGIALTIAAGCAVLARCIFAEIEPLQIVGYLSGVAVLLLGGLIDDRKSLRPGVQFLFPVAAALLVIMTGTGIIQVTNLAGHGAFSLVWAHWSWTVLGTTFNLSLPSDILTFIWIIVATYAMKILDGLDGLVTGMTVIGAGIVGALSLSLAYFQPSVALLAAIIGGAYLGFLPKNMNPAKQFLGESGSTIAGFSLAVIAILSSAKIAVALSVLAIPIADVALVILGRVKRGAPWFKGDATHLHHKLIQAGLPQRTAVFLYWGIALVAGIAALSLQTKGKIFLIVLLCVIAALASYIAGLKAKRT